MALGVWQMKFDPKINGWSQFFNLNSSPSRVKLQQNLKKITFLKNKKLYKTQKQTNTT